VTFSYAELETTNELGLRWYHTQHGAYPSITTILGTTMPEEKKKALENWRTSLGHARAAEVSKAATTRGTNVHLLIERYLKGEQINQPIGGEPVPGPDLASFNALKLKLEKIDKIWGQEVPLFSRKYEVAGRCDLVGVYKGEPVIVDFKTSAKVKSKDDLGDYKLQLAFYAEAHNEMFGTCIETGIILMVAETGFPLEFRIPLKEQLPELDKRVAAFWNKILESNK
jgi:hypothetical protein